MEEWRDVRGYEEKYAVSNWGRVKSLNYKRTGKEQILRPLKNKWGYLRTELYKGGKCKWYAVHRLVLMTFSPVENMDKLDINHIDEDKTNNCLSNLAWTTHKDNCNHGTRNMRMAEKLRGKPNTKLSIPVVQLSLDGKLVNVYKSSYDAERLEGFYQGNIIQCCKNKYLREGNNIYKGFRWVYLYYYISKIDTRIKKIILFDKEYLI